MKKSIPILILLLVVVFQLHAQNNSFAEDEIIIKIKENVPFVFENGKKTLGIVALDDLNNGYEISSIQKMIRSKPQRAVKNRPNTDKILVIKFNQKVDVEALAAAYMETNTLEYAEPNFIGHSGGVQGYSPNDPEYSKQWQFYNDGSFNNDAVVGADMNMEAAWDITKGDSGIVVTILDSGMKLNHPEIVNRLWRNSADNDNDGVDDDANGYADDFQGWDFAYDDNVPNDAYGHGTNVGSIIGMSGDNGVGLAGVDWNCKLMIGKILNDNDYGLYSWWAAGIYYAVDNGSDVINMSVGGTGQSSSLQAAVNYAHANGVVVVVCMMNTDNNTPYYPAAYANTIAVGATGVDDKRVSPFFWSNASGSNYGAHIDLVAPGSPIYGLSYNSNTNYNAYWGGTSQASPQVAGVVALIKSIDPSLDVEAIRSILKNTADDQIGDPNEDIAGWDQYYGAGRLNAGAALASVQSTSSDNDIEIVTPTVTISPNPTTDFIQINANGKYIEQLSIYAMNGQLMRQWNDLNKEQPLSVKGFAAGVYVVEMMIENRQITKKIVVE